MDIWNKALDIAIETYGINPFELLIYLIFLGILLWLIKEFREQEKEDETLKKQLVEKSSHAYATLLYEGTRFETEKDINHLYKAVFDLMPVIDQKTAREMLGIVTSGTREIDKVEQLTKLARREFDYLSGMSGNHSLRKKLLLDHLEEFVMKIVKIFRPLIKSVVLLYFLLFVVSLPFSEVQSTDSTIRFLDFTIFLIMLIFMIDLITEKKLTWSIGVILSGIIISSLFGALNDGIIFIIANIINALFLLVFLWLVFQKAKSFSNSKIDYMQIEPIKNDSL